MRIQTLKNEYIGILAFGLFGLLFASIILRTGYQQFQSKHWSRTTGKITESDVSFSSLRKTYSLAVRYTYVVNGTRYVSERFDFYRHGYTSNGAAMAKLSPYSIGSRVTVYYDPQNHHQAVLNRQVPVTVYLIYSLMIGGTMTPFIFK
jgi:Protein of unknown function (DUF3592)